MWLNILIKFENIPEYIVAWNTGELYTCKYEKLNKIRNEYISIIENMNINVLINNILLYAKSVDENVFFNDTLPIIRKWISESKPKYVMDLWIYKNIYLNTFYNKVVNNWILEPQLNTQRWYWPFRIFKPKNRIAYSWLFWELKWWWELFRDYKRLKDDSDDNKYYDKSIKKDVSEILLYYKEGKDYFDILSENEEILLNNFNWDWIYELYSDLIDAWVEWIERNMVNIFNIALRNWKNKLLCKISLLFFKLWKNKNIDFILELSTKLKPIEIPEILELFSKYSLKFSSNHFINIAEDLIYYDLDYIWAYNIYIELLKNWKKDYINNIKIIIDILLVSNNNVETYNFTNYGDLFDIYIDLISNWYNEYIDELLSFTNLLFEKKLNWFIIKNLRKLIKIDKWIITNWLKYLDDGNLLTNELIDNYEKNI